MADKKKKETTATQAAENSTQEQAAVVETQATPTEQADETAMGTPAVESSDEESKKGEESPAGKVEDEPSVETEEHESEQADEAPAETAAPAPETKAKPAKKKAEALPDFLTPYLRAYPKNKTFHVTSDRMVFLADARSMAVMHQKGLGSGEVTTYNV